MSTITKLFSILGALFFLAACAVDDTPQGILWTDSYQVTDVTVSMADDFRFPSLLELDPVKFETLKRDFPGHMLAILNANARPAFVGTTPVRLEVIVHGMSVPDGVGRAFSVSSAISATARLLNARTGAVLETQRIFAEQEIPHGGGIFIPVSILINSGTTREQRYQEISAEYVKVLLEERSSVD